MMCSSNPLVFEDLQNNRDVLKNLKEQEGKAVLLCWLAIWSAVITEHTELLDYGQSKQKEMFEKCFGLKFKLTEGNLSLPLSAPARVTLLFHYADKALDFQFQYLAPSHPDRSCTITLDVNSEGQWEGAL